MKAVSIGAALGMVRKSGDLRHLYSEELSDWEGVKKSAPPASWLEGWLHDLGDGTC